VSCDGARSCAFESLCAKRLAGRHDGRYDPGDLLARATDESRAQARTKSAPRTWFGLAMFRSLGRRSRGRSRKNLVAMGSRDTIRFEPPLRRRGSVSARRISGIRRGPGKGQAVTNASRCRIKAGPLSPELAEGGWLVGPINARGSPRPSTRISASRSKGTI
jgi:hypothetical protein